MDYMPRRSAEKLSLGPIYRGSVDTVFLGGGTPSQIEPALIGRILEAAQRYLGLHLDAEIAIEVNPGTVDREKFARLKALGCNRISIGAQAFRDADLRHLGRQHSAADVERAYAAARAVGFTNVSFGFGGQCTWSLGSRLAL